LPSVALDLSYESVRSWAAQISDRAIRSRPCDGAVLDRAIAGISTKWSCGSRASTCILWRAVDHEGEVLEILVQRRRDRSAAVKLMRKLLRKQGFEPARVTTDKLGSYGAAFRPSRTFLPP